MKWLFRAALAAMILGMLPALSALAAGGLIWLSICGVPGDAGATCELLGVETGPVIAQLAIWGRAFVLTWPLTVLGLVLMMVWVALRAGARPNGPR